MNTYLIITIENGKEVIVGRRVKNELALKKMFKNIEVLGYKNVTEYINSKPEKQKKVLVY